jgi:hypothetical protein
MLYRCGFPVLQKVYVAVILPQILTGGLALWLLKGESLTSCNNLEIKPNHSTYMTGGDILPMCLLYKRNAEISRETFGKKLAETKILARVNMKKIKAKK